jgi:hypothetical protein
MRHFTNSDLSLDTSRQCCKSGMFYPGSFIKRGVKNKIYLFLAIYGFQEQVLVVLIYIRTIEKRIMKKTNNYLTKNLPYPDPRSRIRTTWIRIRDLGSRIQGVKKHRIPDPDLQHFFKINKTGLLVKSQSFFY